MAETQILKPDVAAAPSTFVVPEGVEFELKAVRADFTDNGAAGDWLPALVIRSDAGHTVSRATDQAVKVTAGDDAEVSWFPGVKHAQTATTRALDAFSPHQEIDLFAYDTAGAYFQNWNLAATVDAACLHNGFSSSDGTQNAFLTSRVSLGPQGSFWLWNVLWRGGPDGGQLRCYMASIPEDDPNYGANDNANVLKDISTLTFVRAWAIDMYNPVVTRNNISNPGFRGPIQNEFSTTLFRVGGVLGAPLTSSVIENPPGLYAKIDGGPGPYAVKFIVETKAGASTSYVARLQSVSLMRTDWAFA